MVNLYLYAPAIGTKPSASVGMAACICNRIASRLAGRMPGFVFALPINQTPPNLSAPIWLSQLSLKASRSLEILCRLVAPSRRKRSASIRAFIPACCAKAFSSVVIVAGMAGLPGFDVKRAFKRTDGQSGSCRDSAGIPDVGALEENIGRALGYLPTGQPTTFLSEGCRLSCWSIARNSTGYHDRHLSTELTPGILAVANFNCGSPILPFVPALYRNRLRGQPFPHASSP